MKLWHVPVRAASGAFILNSGLSKRGADDERAKQLHGLASGTYPQFKDMEPKQFLRYLSTGEIALGGLLLAPVVPSGVAGAALTAFAGGLVRLYLNTPGLTREDGIRPSEQGVPLAKDVWLLSIGTALVIDALTSGVKGATVGTARRTRRSARKVRKRIR